MQIPQKGSSQTSLLGHTGNLSIPSACPRQRTAAVVVPQHEPHWHGRAACCVPGRCWDRDTGAFWFSPQALSPLLDTPSPSFPNDPEWFVWHLLGQCVSIRRDGGASGPAAVTSPGPWVRWPRWLPGLVLRPELSIRKERHMQVHCCSRWGTERCKHQ